jgi:hypothetical protein
MASGGVAVSGHHSFYTTDPEREVSTITGYVQQLVYQHPHAFVYVASEAEGGARIWAVECGSPKQIGSWQSAEALKPGDFVVVTGSPGRDQAAGRLRMREIVRPRDGRRWTSQQR